MVRDRKWQVVERPAGSGQAERLDEPEWLEEARRFYGPLLEQPESSTTMAERTIVRLFGALAASLAREERLVKALEVENERANSLGAIVLQGIKDGYLTQVDPDLAASRRESADG